MTDTSDNKLVEGVINFTHYDNEKISGTYTKDKVFDDSFPGYVSMKGFFSGTVDIKEKKVLINANPKIADNNVFINLGVLKDSLAGRWTFSTMKGTVGTGNFYAVKIKK
jgi:hypothetical protein